MLILFPLLFWLLAFLAALRLQGGRLGPAALWTTLIWLVVAVVLVEGLGTCSLLTPGFMAAGWALACLAALYFRPDPRELPAILRALKLREWTLFEKTLLGLVLLVLLTTLVVAVVAPSNNYDSMVYHMSRVENWIQDHSLAHFPTNVVRQLSMAPGAEYVILIFQLLLGSDYLANTVQWAALAASIILSALIAGRLGGNRKEQLLSALVCATLPMAILQATSTQTDLAAAFLALAFAYFALERGAWGMGLSLGLGLLVKPFVIVFCLPFFTWWLAGAVRREGVKVWRPLLIVMLIPLLMNLPYSLRNYATFGSLTGPSYDTINQAVSLKNSALNLVKWGAGNFTTPFAGFNSALYRGVARLSGPALNDPRTTAYGDYEIIKYTPHEDVAGNPVHLLLFALCVSLLYYNRRRFAAAGELGLYGLSAVAGGLLFFLIFKYQIGVFRYLLPGFVLAAPLAGLVAGRTFNRPARVLLVVLLLAVAFPPLFMNVSRPIIPPPGARRSTFSILTTPRQQFYFSGILETYGQYRRIAGKIKERGDTQIGTVNLYYGYPLWVLLHDAGLRFTLREMEVDNESARYRRPFVPTVVISFTGAPSVETRYRRHSRERLYLGRNDRGEPVTVYLK